MKILKSLVCLLSVVATGYCSNGLAGFGENTVGGGSDGNVYHVKTYREFKIALENDNNPNGPKIIYIDSSIDGFEDDSGKILSRETIAPDYNFETYKACFGSDGAEWKNNTFCNRVENFRQIAIERQTLQTNNHIHSNTTIIGSGVNSKIKNIVLYGIYANNLIFKDLYIETPRDLFPKWVPEKGKWVKSSYSALSFSLAENVWIDNCYFTDGENTRDKYEIIFNKPVETHGNMISISSGDNITISNNRFEDHDSAILIGYRIIGSSSYFIGKFSSTRQRRKTELKITMYNNVFYNCAESISKMRNGKLHIYNNCFYHRTPNTHSYEFNHFIGLGSKCNILSESNLFNRIAGGNGETKIIRALENNTIFHDVESEYNGNKIDLDQILKDNLIFDNIYNYTTSTFFPNQYYRYELTSINRVSDLLNRIPSWYNDIRSDKISKTVEDKNLNSPSGADSLIKMTNVNLLIVLMTIIGLINLI